jgi:hypothetical protein
MVSIDMSPESMERRRCAEFLAGEDSLMVGIEISTEAAESSVRLRGLEPADLGLLPAPEEFDDLKECEE